MFTDRIGSSIYQAILTEDKGERPLDMNKIAEQIDIDSAQTLRTISSRIIPGDKENEIYEDCIRYIRHQKLLREDARITAKLRDTNLDRNEAEKLMQRQIEIQKSIKG